MKELTENYPAVMTVLKSASSVREASDAMLLWYERPADTSEAVQAKRAGFGQGHYEKYAEESGGGTASNRMTNMDRPFMVEVMATDLNIRRGSGTNTEKKGKYTGAVVFTIVEVKRGKGSDKGWGKANSGAGWIALDHCQRV